MQHEVYASALPVWLVQTRRKVGSIPAGSFVTNLYGLTRKDARISDWFANEPVKRRDFRLVRGFIPRNSLAIMHFDIAANALPAPHYSGR